jgi:UDP-N-acetylglucosamine 2-epimerase (non-hydrolysing)/GDP/UDP-N,N'-diacetylbacillosamine 2-epimerase (hydrolysing)
MEKRRVCVATGSRADYGLLSSLMRRLQEAADFQLQVLATGMHLSAEFGHTIDLVRADGFAIDAEVDMLLAADTRAAMAKSAGLGMLGCADALSRLAPHIVVVIGDRFEMLAVASTAMLLGIPIAHIHGGEVTEGAVDESIRHAITKMASLHFVAADPYRRRVIQLGEAPERVFLVGATGLDALAQLQPLGREALGRQVGLDLDDGFFLVTYHPATRGEIAPLCAVNELLAALDRFPDCRIVMTKSNADADGRAINQRLAEYQVPRKDRVALVASLGQPAYLSALIAAAVVIGNSSSGIIEAPAVGTPTVNIGSRQHGRLRAASIVDCAEHADEIAAAIGKVRDPAFRRLAAACEPPYGRPRDAAGRIVAALRGVPLASLRVKPFHDLPPAKET